MDRTKIIEKNSSLTKEQFRHLPGSTEETVKNSFRITTIPDEFRNEHLQNTNRHTNLFSNIPMSGILYFSDSALLYNGLVTRKCISFTKFPKKYNCA